MLEFYRRHGSNTGRFRTSMKEPAISFGSPPKCNCERLTGHRPGSLACRGFKFWNLRRRVGQQQVAQVGLCPSGDQT